MKNLNSVFAAYAIGWAVFFVYYLTVASRTLALRKDLARMKRALTERK
ncbi:MAG TPA: hypothetical protein VN982_15160 [Candidatus Dormibacteraeota bacterium]|nr:hypothetical protein [Candidatus Dormibacteraeota bacterium]